jgi:carotenoid 1,2-hydratase
VSDDRRASLVVIALLGNPFSPRYARAREQTGGARALDHSAMNVSVDAPGVSRWSLTERSGAAVVRERDAVAIGPSAMRRTGDGSIVVDIDERSAPFRSRIRGRVTLRPRLVHASTVALDGSGAHLWSPRIPLADVEVSLTEPRLFFAGTGYLDENAGDEPLETAFSQWSWSRMATRHEVEIAYDVTLRNGRVLTHGMSLGRRAAVPREHRDAVDLGRTCFGLSRKASVRRGRSCRVVRTLEDGPFYARSLIEGAIDETLACGVHETVSLDRFTSRWVRFLLPFRMRVEAA